jgi:hypothetical protein
MFKKFPIAAFVILTLLCLFQFYLAFYPMFDSYVSTRVFISGSKEQFISKKFYTKAMLDENTLLRRSREIGLRIGYSNKSYYESNSFEYKDYSRVLLRNTLFSLLPAIFVLSIILIGVFYSIEKKEIAFLICIFSLMIFLLSNFLFSYNISDQFFFPETIKFFNPLEVKTEFDYLPTSTVVFFEIFFAILLSFLGKNLQSTKPKTQIQGVIQ